MALTKVTGQVIKNTTDVTVGVLTVTNTLAVGGTVSIGGTLTYEDVTNVDAVGLITARDGIKVGSGITLSVDGDGFFTGVITATSYSGIDLSDVTGATGDFSIADKIVHTGDTNTAIRFPAADTITAETGGSERARIDSSGRVLIGTTTEGHTSGDDLTIATSDTTGITLRGGSSGGGRIFFSDGTSGDAEYEGVVGYDHGTNYLYFSTNHAERLRIDSSGRLLINKTSDRGAYYGGTYSGYLQVEGTGNLSRLTQFIHNTNAASQHILVLGKSRGTSVGSYTVVQNSDYLGTLSFQGADGDAMIEGARIDAIVSGAPGDQDMPTALTFGTTADGASSTTERLRITSSGEMGLGTATPPTGTFTIHLTETPELNLMSTQQSQNNNCKLNFGIGQSASVSGNTGARIEMNIPNTGGAMNGELKFFTNSGDNLQERMRIRESGNVGINVTDPDQKLEVDGIIKGSSYIQTGASGTNTNNFHFGAEGDGTFRLYHKNYGAGDERIRIDGSGNLMLSQTTALAKLTVAATWSQAPISCDLTSSNSSGAQINFRFNNSAVGNIVSTSSNTAYNTTSSDRALKKNFEDWNENTLDLFKSLKPQKFHFLNDEDSDPKSKGYIAQDLVDSFPEAYPINPQTDKYDFNPSGMVTYLMKALQEEIVKREALEARISTLEGS